MKWIETWYLSNALLGAAAAGLIPILLPLEVGRTGNAAAVGFVMAAFSLGGLTAPVWGGLADRRRLHRQLFAGGLLLLAAATGAFPLAASLLGRVGLAFLQGAGLATASTVANLFVLEAHPRAEWDSRIGWLQAFYGGGQVAGLCVAGVLGQTAGAVGLWTAAGLCVLAIPPVVLAAPRLPATPLLRRPVLTHPVHHAEWPSGSPQRMYHHLDLRSLRWLRTPGNAPLALFLVAWLLSFTGSAAFFSLYPVVMQRGFGTPPALSSIVFAAAAGAGLALYAPAGRWSGRRGPRVVLRWGLAARVAAFLVLWAVTLAPVPSRAAPAAASFLLVVLAWSALSVASTALVAKLSPAAEGEGIGVFNAVTAVAGVIGSVAGGWAASLWGYSAVPVIALAGVAAGLIMMSAFRSREGVR